MDGGGEEAVRAAERLVGEAAGRLTSPDGEDCLACYLERMVEQHGCDGTLRWTEHWQAGRPGRVEDLRAWVQARGGYCDCEVLTNALGPDPLVDDDDPDDDDPDDGWEDDGWLENPGFGGPGVQRRGPGTRGGGRAGPGGAGRPWWDRRSG